MNLLTFLKVQEAESNKHLCTHCSWDPKAKKKKKKKKSARSALQAFFSFFKARNNKIYQYWTKWIDQGEHEMRYSP
jgi:hypothetical protein